jgi:hypothetical protein
MYIFEMFSEVVPNLELVSSHALVRIHNSVGMHSSEGQGVRDDGCQDTGLQRQAQPGVAIHVGTIC